MPSWSRSAAIPAARTQVMSGQIDTGWSAAPVMLDEVRKGNVRIVASGADVKQLADWSIRLDRGQRQLGRQQPRASPRGSCAHCGRGSSSSTRAATALFSATPTSGSSTSQDARRAPEYTPLKDVTYTPLNMDGVMQLAVEEKMINEPLTAEQKKKLVDIVYDPAKDR